MRNNRLIIFEGIPGSGKTTSSKKLHQYFIENDIKSTLFIEGSTNPFDLPFYAFMKKGEFENLLHDYPDYRNWVMINSIIESEYSLVPYMNRADIPFSGELINHLKSKEFCYAHTPVVSFDDFKCVFYRRFEKYVREVEDSESFTIFESILFQHQIHDINRLYPDVSDSEIIDYLVKLSEILVPLNPILYYISHNSVEESLRRIAKVRSKPKWSTRDSIDYYENRKTVEIRALNNLKFRHKVIDCTHFDWGKVFNNVISALGLH